MRTALVVTGWELRKLAVQLRVRLLLTAALMVSPLLAVGLAVQDALPRDTLLGRQLQDAGLSLPLVVLGFSAQWALPVLLGLVAGDLFSSEDQAGTWKTVLTRGVSRGSLFAGKALAGAAFTAALLTVLGVSSTVAGLLGPDRQPLLGLSGAPLDDRTALVVTVASWASLLPPALALASVGLLASVLSRTSAVGVAVPVLVGFVMQLLSFVPGLGLVARALLPAPLGAWHGLVRDDRYYGPLVEGALVSTLWVVVCLGVAHRSFSRRDVAAG